MSTNRSVYIVDDDEAICDSLSYLNEITDLNVETYSSAREFLDAKDLSSQLKGCLVTDLRMPEMTGIELLEHLWEHKVFLPTIILSGHMDDWLAIEIVEQKNVEFMHKPFSVTELLDRILEKLG